jgi:hypothetical protein
MTTGPPCMVKNQATRLCEEGKPEMNVLKVVRGKT